MMKDNEHREAGLDESFLIWQKTAIFLVTLLTLLSYRAFRNKHQPELVRIPGPWLAAYTKFWRVFDVLRGSSHQTAIRLHSRYGSLVRIAPNVVSVSDPALIPIIYNTKEDFTKTAFYPIQCITWKKKPEQNLFSTRDPEYHKVEQRKVGSAFGAGKVLQSESVIGSCIELCMNSLQSVASSRRSVDLGEWLQFYTFDVVGEVTFGQKFGFLEQGKDVDGMISNIKAIIPYSAICGQVPEYHKYLLGNPFLSKIIPPMETWNQVLIFTLKAISSRASFSQDGDLISSDVEGYDQLSRWAYVKSSEPDKMNTRDIVVHTSANVFAGSETTAIALRAIIDALLRNPACMSLLDAELTEADEAGIISSPITYKEAVNHLPYVSAVIKEGMRLHPSLGLLLERHVPPQGMKVVDTVIPAGTIVGINPWVVTRNNDVFPDPDDFKPERWLELESNPRRKEMEAIWDFIFGAGSRTCIGKHIALIEIYKFIPELFRRFNIEVEDPTQRLKILNRWFVQQSGLICNLTPR